MSKSDVYLDKSIFLKDVDINGLYEFLEKIKSSDGRTRYRLKRMLKDLFSDVDYEIFRRFPLNENTEISVVGGEYIVMRYSIELRRKYRRYFEYVRRRAALIGIDKSTNKLFINILDEPIFNRTQLGFRYHMDEIVDLNDAIIKNGHITVRVQGDLVFTISNLDSNGIEMIERIMYRELVLAYNRKLSETVSNMVQSLLQSNRISNIISISLTPEYIYICISIRITRTRKIDMYKNIVESLLSKFSDSVLKNMNGIGNINTFCTDYNNRFRSNESEIVCSININIDREYVFNALRIREIVEKLLKNPSRYTMMFGNHEIEWFGIPNRFTVKTTYNGNEYSSEIVLINNGMPFIVALPKSEIMIRHSEHGENVIRVEIPLLISISNTIVSEIDTLIRNRLNILKLLNRLNI